MRTQNPQIERTPMTLVIRQAQLSQGCWFSFGLFWLALLVPAGCIFLAALLVGASGFFVSGWEPDLHEFVSSWNMSLLILGLFFALFTGIGTWMVAVGIRREHLEAHVWTFDKSSRSLKIVKEMRNRTTKALRTEHVGTHPLPAPGDVQVRRIATTEHFENELVITTDGRKIHGMRQRTLGGDLGKVAEEINEFLAAG